MKSIEDGEFLRGCLNKYRGIDTCLLGGDIKRLYTLAGKFPPLELNNYYSYPCIDANTLAIKALERIKHVHGRVK